MKKLLLLILIASAITSYAQEIKDFSLTNVKDGKSVSLSNFSSSSGIVVVFTSHECPYDNYYKDRLKDLVNAYSGKIQFLFINSNQETQESAEQM
ncbi:MAG TPA: redoxin domain-containing protein, partial [Cyclobacteriaceae bacterium]|nr:redoxin domain-containing protein [Cyclobacteriaceae bacterium]